MLHDFTEFFEKKRYDPRDNFDSLLPKPGKSEYIAVFGKEKCNIDARFIRFILADIYALSPTAHITLILDVVSKAYVDAKQLDDLNLTIQFIPYWLVWTYCAHNKLTQQTAQGPVPTGKISYMPGKLDKLHRLVPVQVLNTLGMLEDIKLSLHVPSDDSVYRERIQQKLDIWDTDKRIQTVGQLEKYNRSLDVDLTLHTMADTFHLTGIPYDVSIYQDVSFAVISESDLASTNMYQSWLTEKTYRTIFNQIPFIQVCAAETTLHKMGFETFEDLYRIPDLYRMAIPGGVEDLDTPWSKNPLLRQYERKMAKAIANMQRAMITHTQEIVRRTTHNKQHMDRLANMYLGRVRNQIVTVQGTVCDLSYLLTQVCSYPNCHKNGISDATYQYPLMDYPC